MQNDPLVIELLKELKEISKGVNETRVDIALIKDRQSKVMNEVTENKAEVDNYCLEDRKMHKWIKTAIIIMAAVEVLILFGAEDYAKQIFQLGVKLI